MRALVPSAWREDDAATSHDRHPGEPTTRPRSAILDPAATHRRRGEASVQFDGVAQSADQRWTPGRFPGDDAFSTIARAVCDADALLRKELPRPGTRRSPSPTRWTDVARRGRDDEDDDDDIDWASRHRRCHRRVMDLAGGHGFLAMCLLIINPRLSSAVVVDRRKPDSHERLVSSLAKAFPGVEGTRQVAVRRGVHRGRDADAVHDAGVGPRVRGFERSRAEARGRSSVARRGGSVLPPGIGSGSSVRGAIKRGLSRVRRAEGTGGSKPSPICPSAAMDVARLELLRRAGFRVHARTIPREITPKNRVIVGAAAAATTKTKTTRTTRLPVGAPSRTRYRRVRGSGTSSGRSDALILAS